MARFTLFWQRHISKYKIERRDYGHVIVPNADAVEVFDAGQLDLLWKKLANTPASKTGILEFANTYGLLTARPDKKQIEQVQTFRRTIRVMRWLATVIESEDWSALDLWVEKNRAAITVNPSLIYDRGEARPSLFFQPRTLADLLYLQAIHDATSGTKYRACKLPGCPEWFKYGPGTERTERAAYCSDKCRFAHAYEMRKEQAK